MKNTLTKGDAKKAQVYHLGSNNYSTKKKFSSDILKYINAS